MEKTYYEPLYKIWITVFIEPKPEKAKARAEKLCGGDSLDDLDFNVDAKTIEYTSKKGGQRLVVWLKKRSAEHLAHEFIHVIIFAFERMRIKIGYDNDEVIAYLMEHLMNKFRSFY